MFGHQDDHHDHHDQQPADNLIPGPTIDGILASDNHSSTTVTGDEPSAKTADDSFNPALPPADNQPGDSSTAIRDDATVVTGDDHPAQPTPFGEPNEPKADAKEPEVDFSSPAPADPNDLLDIKQQALTQLTPLVGHLEQSPEEKFRTTMMMIQANDNQALIQTAYQAAQAIPDEKAKAQALLDIVNEINYFTQHSA